MKIVPVEKYERKNLFFEQQQIHTYRENGRVQFQRTFSVTNKQIFLRVNFNSPCNKGPIHSRVQPGSVSIM